MAQQVFNQWAPVAKAQNEQGQEVYLPFAGIHAQTRDGKDEVIVGAGNMVWTESMWVPVSTQNRLPVDAAVSGTVDVSDRADRQLGKVALTGRIEHHSHTKAVTDTSYNSWDIPGDVVKRYREVEIWVLNTLKNASGGPVTVRLAVRPRRSSYIVAELEDGTHRLIGSSASLVNHKIPAEPNGIRLLSTILPSDFTGTTVKEQYRRYYSTPGDEDYRIEYNANETPVSGAFTIWLRGVI